LNEINEKRVETDYKIFNSKNSPISIGYLKNEVWLVNEGIVLV